MAADGEERSTVALSGLVYPWAAWAVGMLPGTRIFNRTRGWIVGRFLEGCGRGLIIAPGFIINKPRFLRVGNNCAFNVRIFIGASKDAPITIGSNVIIGPHCVLRSRNHRFERLDVPIREQGHEGKPIVIEDDCWLGSCTVVLPGVTIGRGSVVGAGSVVTRNMPPYSVAMGVPARVERNRQEPAT